MTDTRPIPEQALELIRDQMATADSFGHAIGGLICSALEARPAIADKILQYSQAHKDMLKDMGNALHDVAKSKQKGNRYAMEDDEALKIILKELGETEGLDINDVREAMTKATTAEPPKAQTSAHLDKEPEDDIQISTASNRPTARG